MCIGYCLFIYLYLYIKCMCIRIHMHIQCVIVSRLKLYLVLRVCWIRKDIYIYTEFLRSKDDFDLS